ncbi:hypothetical protein [Archangium violaceum]|uniref:hypothetical protein n=1 Tax=Archangium violaceum TaxID=83451 RepID=UPI0036D9BEA6
MDRRLLSAGNHIHGFVHARSPLSAAEEFARLVRKPVLEPGGSKPAAEMVKEFLGRPYGFEAYRAYIDQQ